LSLENLRSAGRIRIQIRLMMERFIEEIVIRETCRLRASAQSELYAGPKRRSMDVPVNAAHFLPLVSTMFFPAPLIVDINIVIDIR